MRDDLVAWHACLEKGLLCFGLQRCTLLHSFRAEMPQPAVGQDIPDPTSRSAGDADVLRVIGFLLLQHGKVEQAVGLFDALHALFPDDIGIGLSLSYALLQIGNAEEASFVLEEIESFSDFSSGYSSLQKNPCFCWLRSQAFVQSGQSNEAARWMRIFLRLRRQSTSKVTL
jgi:hypothetical protein